MPFGSFQGSILLKHLPMYSWAPFLCRTEEALQTLFLGKGLMLFFTSSGGSVLRTSTISETLSSEPRWLGVFSVWNSLAVTLRFVS